ncbi:MAG: sugar phosphate isomerase/epimerase family protein [Planctomycetota bacterium]
MDRRSALGAMSQATCGACLLPALQARSAEGRLSTGLGLVIYGCRIRQQWTKQRNPGVDLFDPLTFLKHCKWLGAGGMQAKLNSLDAAGVRRVRDYAEEHSLFIDAIVSPPKDESDVGRFEEEVRQAADAGVQAVRTVIMPGRRYEQFQSLAEFKQFEARGRRMAELAAPIVEKHRVPLAIENHKDQRNDERVALFEHIDSEFVGACVDTGNSFALLEDPIETVERLAPWAKTVHLKDQAVQDYPDGFLLGDIPLGQGCFDLKRMVAILQKAQPRIRFALELLTRDALKVPCLTEKFWATMADVPASDLARTLRVVRERRAEALQQVSSLPLERQVALEDTNVAASLKYARDVLRL